MPRQQADKIILEAQVRAQAGKEFCGRIRREGWIPGVVYGEGGDSVAVQVGAREFSRILRTKAGGNILVTLRLKRDPAPKGGESDSAVLIRQMQLHPVSHKVIHIDFHRVSLAKRITVTVPLSFKGEARGVRMEGGVLERLRWDLEVVCLPTEIPNEIPVDVSEVGLNQTLHAKDVALPEGVRLATDAQLPVAACVVPKVEEAAAPAVEAGAQAAEPEVLKQKKPEEIAAEEEAKAQEKKEKAAEGKEKGEKSAKKIGGSAT